jgi:hypothetical protein
MFSTVASESHKQVMDDVNVQQRDLAIEFFLEQLTISKESAKRGLRRARKKSSFHQSVALRTANMKRVKNPTVKTIRSATPRKLKKMKRTSATLRLKTLK